MRKLALLLAAILICGLIFGCAPPKPPVPAGGISTPPPTPTPTQVATIDIGWPMAENWDADAEVDSQI
jgi:hypothetical protein